MKPRLKTAPWRERSTELHPRYAETGDLIDRLAWRGRAVQEGAAVRRAIRLARTGRNAAIGPHEVIEAMESGDVRQIMLTPRFVEFHAAFAEHGVMRAMASAISITIVSGSAALALDLAGGGAAALLRPTSTSRAGSGVLST